MNKPWLGFAVKPSTTHTGTLFVSEVAEGSPAHVAGLRDGDHILNIGGVHIHNLEAFWAAVRSIRHQGAEVPIDIMREDDGNEPVTRRLTLQVVSRKYQVQALTPLKNVNDIEALLADEYKFENVADALFDRADVNLDLMVTPNELTNAILSWIVGDIGNLVSMDLLQDLFYRFDRRQHGYLSKSDFVPLLRSLLRLVVFAENTRQQQSIDVRKPHTYYQIDVASLYVDWRTSGYRCGVFWEEPNHSWKSVFPPMGHRILVLEGNLTVIIGQRREPLNAGDEIFIPAGNTYSTQQQRPCKVLFGVEDPTHGSTFHAYACSIMGDPQGYGKPWIGFTVYRNRSETFTAKDVNPNGPAYAAGIRTGDHIISVGGMKINSVATFRKAVQLHAELGKVVRVIIRQGRSTSPLTKVDIVVGARTIVAPEYLPQITQLSDWQSVLTDGAKLDSVAQSVFDETDSTGSYLLSFNDFAGAMNKIIPQGNSYMSLDNDLRELFKRVDSHGVGYIGFEQFRSALIAYLQILLENNASGNNNNMSSALSRRRASADSNPWIGFTVRKSKNKSNVVVKEVVAGGPAHRAGLQSNDELVSLGGMRTPTIDAFRVAVKAKVRVGTAVQLEVLRDKDGVDNALRKAIDVLVTTRPKQELGDVPTLSNRNDLESILLNEYKLQSLTNAAFADADNDFSGIISSKEFAEAMRRWLPQTFSSKITDKDLEELFRRVDVDKTGYLSRDEFDPLIAAVLQLLIEYTGPSAVHANATTVKLPVQPGKAWIGFAVKKSKGKDTIFVIDVAEGGPAWVAGIRDKDELVSFGGIQTNTMEAFNKAMREHKVPGKVVTVMLLREEYGSQGKVFATELIIGRKQKEVISDVPHVRTITEVQTVLNNPVRLEKLSSYIFSEFDEDMSGLLRYNEFVLAMQSVIPQDLIGVLTLDTIRAVFEAADTDKSGYMAKSEFTPVVKGILSCIVDHYNKPNSSPNAAAKKGKKKGKKGKKGKKKGSKSPKKSAKSPKSSKSPSKSPKSKTPTKSPKSNKSTPKSSKKGKKSPSSNKKANKEPPPGAFTGFKFPPTE